MAFGVGVVQTKWGVNWVSLDRNEIEMGRVQTGWSLERVDFGVGKIWTKWSQDWMEFGTGQSLEWVEFGLDGV